WPAARASPGPPFPPHGTGFKGCRSASRYQPGGRRARRRGWAYDRSPGTVRDPHLGRSHATSPAGGRWAAGAVAERGRAVPERFPAAVTQAKSVPAGGVREAIVHLLFAIRLDLVALAAYRHCP